MNLFELNLKSGKYKTRKRVGRGHAAGGGKTAGRGHNGAHSRSGWSKKRGFEGGQTRSSSVFPSVASVTSVFAFPMTSSTLEI